MWVRFIISSENIKGEALAETWRMTSAALPVRIEVPSAEDIWSAAVLKSQFPISYADAFAAALCRLSS
jgi:hypothetical protein